jgi:lambda family phage portal protein
MTAPQLNWFDRVVSSISPEAGVRRMQARMALGVIRKYESAEVGRRTSGWKAASSSANVEVEASIDRVRARASQMVRDNEYAKAAIRALTTHIVGTGITVIPKLKAERDAWRAWCDDECDADGQLDLAGLMRLACWTWKVRGEVLVRRRWRRLEDGLRVPMQLQLLEADMLDHTRTEVRPNGNVVIMGVEFDRLGRRNAYWLWPEHPGETGLVRARAMESRAVPASEILHVYRKDRISQVRGMPELAASLMRLRDLDSYEEAELVRKKIESCFAVFVHTSDPRTSMGDLRKDHGTGRPVEKVSPGMIKYLAETEQVTVGSPTAVGGYGEYTAAQLHAIAAGAGVTYYQLTGDNKGSSYTSHRAALREFYSLVDQEQWLTWIPMFVRPVRRWWRDAAAMAGQQLGDKPDDITTPRKLMVDPLKDAMADKEEVRGGLSTLYEKWRERGLYPEDVMEELAVIQKTLVEKGLVLDVDAGVKELKLTPAQVLAASASNGENA